MTPSSGSAPQDPPSDDIDETEIPPPGLPSPQLEPTREQTRRNLAYGSGLVTAGIAGAALASMWTGSVPWDDMKDYLAFVFTPLLTLTSMAWGFYFGSRS